MSDAVHPGAGTVTRGRRGARGGRLLCRGPAPHRPGAPTGERGGREGGSARTRKRPALTSPLAPSPGGVLAADVFHKVQNDKKPRDQSQAHSNPVLVPFSSSFFCGLGILPSVLERDLQV